MSQLEYKKYRLGKWMDLAKLCVVVGALTALIIFAPNQATQFASYLGFFLFGASKAKSYLGL